MADHTQEPSGPPRGAPAPAPVRSLFGAAGLVSLATSLSRVGGLIREQMFAALLGAGFYSDAFVVAFRIPNLLRDLLAEGALSTAFVPTFTQTLVQKGRLQAFALGNLVLTTLLVITAAVVLIGILWAPAIVQLIAPGFAQTPGKLELTTLLTRILFPFLSLIALAAVLMGMLNAQQRFFLPALAPALFNLAAITVGATLLFLGTENQTAVIAWTSAVLFGGLLQFLVQIPALRRLGWRYHPRFRPRFDDPGLRQIMRLMAPAVIGLSATQLNILINNILASQLEQGSPSWINYAFRLMQLPIGVFGVAVATVNLTAISRSAAAGAMDEFRSTLGKSLRLVAFLTVPSTIGLVALRQPIIHLLYEHGRFSPYDTLRTADVLMAYAIGLYFYAAVKVLAPAFYALKATRIPMVASFSAVACNITANLLLYQRLGAPGLALGTSIGAVVNIAILYGSFVRRWGSLQERELLLHLLRVVVAATVMGIACHWCARWLLHYLGNATIAADLAVTLIPVGIGVAIYLMLTKAMKVGEVAILMRRLRRS